MPECFKTDWTLLTQEPRQFALQEAFRHDPERLENFELLRASPGWSARLLADAYDAACHFGVHTTQTKPGRRILYLRYQPNPNVAVEWFEVEAVQEHTIPQIRIGPYEPGRLPGEWFQPLQRLYVMGGEVEIHPWITSAVLRDCLSSLDLAMHKHGFFVDGYLTRRDVYAKDVQGFLPIEQVFAYKQMEICAPVPLHDAEQYIEWLRCNRFQPPSRLVVRSDTKRESRSIYSLGLKSR